jgi:CRISPR-associated protein Csa3
MVSFQIYEMDNKLFQPDVRNPILVLLFTMGFDERFVLRSILRNGLQSGETILLILPVNGEEARAEKAINTLKTFVKQTQHDAKIELIRVKLDDVYSAVSDIGSILRSTRERIIANLSGGMRLLILVTLAAILSSGVNAKIEVDMESGKGPIILPLELYKPLNLEPVDIVIMRKLSIMGKRVNLEELAESLEMNKSSVWRRMRNLEEKRLVASSKVGRKMEYNLTESGIAILKIS